MTHRNKTNTGKKQIFLVRHGETNWNKEQRMQGLKDIPLNEKGLLQAQKVGTYLAGYSFDVILSSPLQRAYQTASAIAAHHPKTPLRAHTSLHERSFGLLDGMTYEEINAAYPSLIFSETWQHPHFCPPEGERLTDVQNRIIQFIKTDIFQSNARSILVVAHGVSLRMVMGSLLKLEIPQLRDLHLDNASLSLVSLEKNEAQLSLFNETGYLEEL